METGALKRLNSYKFNCPCCMQPHERLFEYYAKYYGPVPDDMPLTSELDASMLERVVVLGKGYETWSPSVGNSTYMCGNCFEFFKFEDKHSDPIKLTPEEKSKATLMLSPITITQEQAVLNSVGSFVGLLNQFGCSYDPTTGDIVIKNSNNQEFRFNISKQLLDVFYSNNPIFDIKKSESWAHENFQAKTNENI